jgi:hypothetical protein
MKNTQSSITLLKNYEITSMHPYSLKNLRNVSHCECFIYGSRCEYYAQYGMSFIERYFKTP